MTRVDLSPESQAALASVAVSASDEGDIWGMPGAWMAAWFPSAKDGRPCLVAVLEETANGTLFAHVVGGTGDKGGHPTTVMVPKGEGGLTKDTYFKFRWSTRVAVSDLTRLGRSYGKLNPSYVPRIEAAIEASNRTAMKRALRKRTAARVTSAATSAGTPAAGAPSAAAASVSGQNVSRVRKEALTSE